MNKNLRKLGFLNRQPSLFRHGCVAMEMVPSDDDDDETIGLSPLTLEPLNADFDGDTCALYVLHDQTALEEVYDKAFLYNYIYYDSSDSVLATLRHEALYAAFLLTYHQETDETEKPLNINSLYDLPVDTEFFNQLNKPVLIKNKLYSYGLCLFNKWCGFNHIVVNYIIDKTQSHNLSKIIYKYFDSNPNKFYDQIAELSKKLFFFITTVHESPTIHIEDVMELLSKTESDLFNKLPSNNPSIGYYMHKGLVERCCQKNLNDDQQLTKLLKSGSRFSKTQLERSAINIGYCADFKNTIISTPIKSNLIHGLSEEDFFRGAIGTRKAISDNSKSTPDSGFLERSLVMALSPLELYEDDCGSPDGLSIVVMSKKHAKILDKKWYKDPDKFMGWELLDYETAKSYINKNIIIRSPMTCQTPYFKLCRKCFGDRYFPTRYIGVTAGQVLAERLTQLTLRTFHQSGSAQLNENPALIKLVQNHLIDINNTDNHVILTFDINIKDNCSEEDILQYQKPLGFHKIEGNQIFYNILHDPVQNIDTVSILNKIKDQLRNQKNNLMKPHEYYEQMTSLILSIGTPFSSFIEMLFANMFAVQTTPETRFWRYNQDEPIIIKFGDKLLADKLSKLLGLLYQPNVETVEKIKNLDQIDLSDEKLTIYEKIFLGNI